MFFCVCLGCVGDVMLQVKPCVFKSLHVHCLDRSGMIKIFFCILCESGFCSKVKYDAPISSVRAGCRVMAFTYRKGENAVCGRMIVDLGVRILMVTGRLHCLGDREGFAGVDLGVLSAVNMMCGSM